MACNPNCAHSEQTYQDSKVVIRKNYCKNVVTKQKNIYNKLIVMQHCFFGDGE